MAFLGLTANSNYFFGLKRPSMGLQLQTVSFFLKAPSCINIIIYSDLQLDFFSFTLISSGGEKKHLFILFRATAHLAPCLKPPVLSCRLLANQGFVGLPYIKGTKQNCPGCAVTNLVAVFEKPKKEKIKDGLFSFVLFTNRTHNCWKILVEQIFGG